MSFITSKILLLIYVFSSLIYIVYAQQTDLNYIFKSGTEGYNTFRIPALVTTKTGRLLAFAEGRVINSSDSGNIDLVMKCSDDYGKTWSELKIIWDDNDNVCGNPAPVVDYDTGEIHLLMTWNSGRDTESRIIEQRSLDTRRIFASYSDDNGNSWSDPREITSSVKKENWTWYATGPCHGIQMKHKNFRNRMIIPCDHIEAQTKKYFSHIIYSEDHGKSWNLGGSTPQDMVNECTVAELPHGRLILNMRNYNRAQKSRKISFSEDGGISWADIQSDSELIEPICQASMYFLKNKKVLFFLNPASETKRENLKLKSSKDYGKTWETVEIICPGPSAYSDLALIGKKRLGCLFEAGAKSPYEGIAFKTVEF